jgi:N-formylglutamate deformylase
MLKIAPVVFHIPHASTFIPKSIRDQFLLSDVELQQELRLMTDLYTAELFGVPEGFIFDRVVSQISRLVTDVERVPIDDAEPMSEHGMGMFYRLTSAGLPLRRALAADEQEFLFESYYRPHHQQLSAAVDRALHKFGRCCIVDCHSFPQIALPYEDARLRRPKVCIGTDPFHTPSGLINAVLAVAKQHFDDVCLNEPFSGSLVSMKHWGSNDNVHSIMIELRRDLYLDSGELNVSFLPTMERFLSELVSAVTDYESAQ